MALVQSNGHVRERPTSVVALAGLVAGLVIGALAALIYAWLIPPAVPMEDYAVVVGAAYARERLPLNATQRLADAGVRDPAGTVAAVAADFPRRYPERQRDAENLAQLADALGALAAPPSTGHIAAPGWWLWPVVFFAAVALIVAMWRLRTHAVRTWRSLPPAEAPKLEKEQLVGGLRSTLTPDDLEGGSPRLPRSPSYERRAATSGQKTGGVSAVARRRQDSRFRAFACSYHAGEEPFEEVHPIMHVDRETLLGACGLTAAAQMESGSPARYYAFTAWVHDYASGEPMQAIGLLSPWAIGRKKPNVPDPTLRWGALHRADKGLTATVETHNLLVTVEIEDVSYGTARDVPANSYFTILSVKFTTTVKR